MAAYFFASPVDVDVKLEGEEERKIVETKGEKDNGVSRCTPRSDTDVSLWRRRGLSLRRRASWPGARRVTTPRLDCEAINCEANIYGLRTNTRQVFRRGAVCRGTLGGGGLWRDGELAEGVYSDETWLYAL